LNFHTFLAFNQDQQKYEPSEKTLTIQTKCKSTITTIYILLFPPTAEAVHNLEEFINMDPSKSSVGGTVYKLTEFVRCFYKAK